MKDETVLQFSSFGPGCSEASEPVLSGPGGP